ncbi:MAG: alpha/beta fold hydrolase [Alphaproteobacteria bacterium]|nr:alpha/beta fold hydrolase [Alphaproteobacteria bacterium]MBV9372333.1 alpha/beta fold hydrolase [Alphaproteobacteria bacterium]MBV9899625.1 alpha/beta fold hydrolase [Alphaproteobacteria bacterium]
MNDEELTLTLGTDKLVVTIDRPAGEERGTVLIVPPFGMSAERLFSTAYLMTLNGLRVYRFDPRNHPGRSTGSIEAFRLSELAIDTAAVLDLCPGAVVLGISLSSRAVMRALAGRDDWRAVVLITPVVDLQYTLREVMGVDLVRIVRSGEEFPDRNLVLGYEVDKVFVNDSIEHDLVEPADTVADLLRCRRPIVFIAGTDDPWVNMEDVRKVASQAARGGRSVEVIAIQAATHQLYRNPVLATAYFNCAVRQCLRATGADPDKIVEPSFAQIIAAAEAQRMDLADRANLEMYDG